MYRFVNFELPSWDFLIIESLELFYFVYTFNLYIFLFCYLHFFAFVFLYNMFLYFYFVRISNVSYFFILSISTLNKLLSLENKSNINGNRLKNELIAMDLNYVVNLEILLTLLSVQSLGKEDCSLKLKLIKHYLRSSIGQTKLINLSLFFSKSTLAGTLD